MSGEQDEYQADGSIFVLDLPDKWILIDATETPHRF